MQRKKNDFEKKRGNREFLKKIVLKQAYKAGVKNVDELNICRETDP